MPVEKGLYNDRLFALSNASLRSAGEAVQVEVAETEGFEPSIGLYNPITV
jgi:hypothetical protein